MMYIYMVCFFVIGFIFYDIFDCLGFEIWLVVLNLDRRLMKFEEYFELAGCSWMVLVTTLMFGDETHQLQIRITK